MVTRQVAGVLRPQALYATEGEPRLSPIPTSVREALADANWRRAMEEEYGALLANQTWDLVPRLQCVDRQVDLDNQATC
jgi:histone deacetylase 1/2